MNALHEFIDAQGLALAEAARLAGTSPVNMHRHYHGHRGISAQMALRYHRAFGIPLERLLSDDSRQTPPTADIPVPVPAPALPSWIVHTPGVGLTCTACDTVAEGVTLDSPEGRKFVADHSGHEDPYPAMRQGQSAEAEVGA